MIELFEQDILLNDRQSSKGNQLKWQSQNGICIRQITQAMRA